MAFQAKGHSQEKNPMILEVRDSARFNLIVRWRHLSRNKKIKSLLSLNIYFSG